MRLSEVLVALALLGLVCTLAGGDQAAHAFLQTESGPAVGALTEGHRLYFFYLAAAAATLATLLAEHGRRIEARAAERARRSRR
jgi:hypothetical protein